MRGRAAEPLVAAVRRVADDPGVPDRLPPAFAADRRARPCRPARRPWRGPQAAALSAASRARAAGGDKQREAAAALGLHTVGDLLEHLPRDTPRGAHRRRAGGRASRRRSPSRSARSRSRPVRRAGMRPLVEAIVADESGSMKADVLQPAVAREEVPGRARGSCCTASTTRATASASTSHAPTSEGVGGAGRRRPLPGDGGALLDADPRARAASTCRSRAPRPSRCRAACAPATGSPTGRPALLAAHGGDARGRPPPAGVRRAAAGPARPAAPPRAPPRGRPRLGAGPAVRGRGPGAGPDSRAAGSTRCCRSSRPATSAARSTRSSATSRCEHPMQRLLMGEVGSGKTVVALAAMLRAVEHGTPGGADGADRDARRAALRDAAGADARRGRARRAADRLDAGGAAHGHPRASSRRASSGWSSARTR